MRTILKGKKFKMKIEKISIEKIKPYENNAKLHPPEQIEQIKKSIIEFGNNDKQFCLQNFTVDI